MESCSHRIPLPLGDVGGIRLYPLHLHHLRRRARTEQRTYNQPNQKCQHKEHSLKAPSLHPFFLAHPLVRIILPGVVWD